MPSKWMRRIVLLYHRYVPKLVTWRAFFQLIVILSGLVFEVMGNGWGRFTMFWLYEQSLRGFVYNAFEHFKFTTIAMMMCYFPPKPSDFKTDRMFVWLSIIDFLDYIVTGNSIYMQIGIKPIFPLSMNLLMIGWFFIYSHRQWKMNFGQHLY